MRTSTALTVAFLAALAFSAPAVGGEAKKAGGDDRAAKRISSSPHYVYGPTLVSALNVRLGAPRASITVELGWDVPDAALRARLGPLRIRLNDALRAALSDFTNGAVRNGAPPDLDMLTRLLQRATDATLGQAGARVMLANVVVLQR